MIANKKTSQASQEKKNTFYMFGLRQQIKIKDKDKNKNAKKIAKKN